MQSLSAVDRLLADDRLEDALEAVDKLLEANPSEFHLLMMRGRIVENLRFLRGQHEQLQLLVRLFPENVEGNSRLIGQLLSKGLGDEALACVRRAGAVLGPDAWKLVADAELLGGNRANALAAIESATSAHPLDAARYLIRAGEPLKARRAADEAVAAAPHDSNARVLQASLALWSGEIEEAQRLVEGIDANAPGRARLCAAVMLALGRFAEGEALANEAIERDRTDIEATVLRAVALRLQGREKDAEIAADAARYAPHGWRNPYSAILQRLLSPAKPWPGEWREQIGVLGPFVDDLVDRGRVSMLWLSVFGRWIAPVRNRLRNHWLRSLLERTSWNLSASPTIVKAGSTGVREWSSIRVHLDVRAMCAETCDLLDTLPFEDVCRRFDAVAATVPWLPFPFTYRAELHLWFGNYREAEENCRHALSIDRNLARFAWVVLACAVASQGRLDEALEVIEEGRTRVTPAALGAYRGEVRWLKGDLAGARKDLTSTLSITPNRVSSRLMLALIAHTEGDVKTLGETHGRLCSGMPDFVRSIRRDMGRDTRAVEETPDDMAQLIRTGLKMMRGNRSSHRMTWFPRDGVPRVLVPVAI